MNLTPFLDHLTRENPADLLREGCLALSSLSISPALHSQSHCAADGYCTRPAM